MCLTRIYCVRTRDGVLFRFSDKAGVVAYSRANHETPRSLPIIDRTEFIRRRNSKYDNPIWIHSKIYRGMSILKEGA